MSEKTKIFLGTVTLAVIAYATFYANVLSAFFFGLSCSYIALSFSGALKPNHTLSTKLFLGTFFLPALILFIWQDTLLLIFSYIGFLYALDLRVD